MLNTHQRRALAYLLMMAAAVAAAVYLGKDFSWDLFSYHLYAGFSAMENRFGLDYFASSAQSYLNPYSHVPLYLMVKHDFAPQLVVAGLAAIHALNLLIVYEIALLLNKRASGAIAWPPVLLAVFLAFCNAVFILELGNTFNEISTSVPVLAGWYLLIRDFRAQRRSRMLLAGVLIGIGIALKLSNLFFSVTVLPLLLLAPASWKQRLQATGLVAAGGMLGLLLADGWWGWQLWQEFGNPAFPFFNEIFKSPEFTTSPNKHYRFIPASGFDVLLRPFQMAGLAPGTYIETAAPDIRYAALFLLLCLFGAKYAAQASPLRAWVGRDPFPAFQEDRALLALAASFVCAWLFWLVSSGNGRYFLPMSCLGSVVLASLFFRFSGKRRFLVYGGVALVLVQGGMTFVASAKRWNPVLWGEHFIEIDIPAELRREPALTLYLSTQPASFLLPYLPKGSAMINPSGMFVIEENAKMRALMDRHRGRIRAMRRYVGKDAGPPAQEFDFFLARFGLAADMATCLPIRFKVRQAAFPDGVPIKYVSCQVKPRPWSAAEREDFLTSKRRSDALFARLETLCPTLFQPRGLASEGDGKQFWRNYANTDTVLQLHPSGVVSYHNSIQQGRKIQLGTLGELEHATSAACR